MNVTIPAAFAKQFKTKLDWELYTEPEPGCDGRSLYCPRGKGLGGSSSMNAMLYVRGRPLDYDMWEQQGATGWGWDGVKDYFLKSENREGGPSEYHAVGGELNVADENSPRAITETFLVAAEAAGIPRIDDYNGPEQDGAALVQVTQKNGKRLSTAEAFLRPAMKRPNLEVVARRPGAARGHRGRPRDRRALPPRRRDEDRPGAQGHRPLGRRVRLAADPDAVRRRAGRPPARRRRAAARRPARASARTSRTTRTCSGSGTFPAAGRSPTPSTRSTCSSGSSRRPGR